MDYSICNALQHKSEGLSWALLIYDIACQFYRNFFARVEQSKSLELQEWEVFIPAVGKWHLSAHIPSCFARHSLNFVWGAGQQDGEILETLWAEFNKVSTNARTMSKAHRAEVYDDHMRDSNWQKIVGMSTFLSHALECTDLMLNSLVASLKKKLKKAEAGLEETRDAFEALTAALPSDKVNEWTMQEEQAMVTRGEALDIYDVRAQKGITIIGTT